MSSITKLPIANGCYRIQNTKKSTFITAKASRNVKISMQPSNESNEQKWYFYSNSDGSYDILNAAIPGYWIGYGATETDAAVIAKPTKTSWSIEPGVKGSFRFLALDDDDYSLGLNSSGVATQLHDEDGDTKLQQWNITSTQAGAANTSSADASSAGTTVGSRVPAGATLAVSRSIVSGNHYRIRNFFNPKLCMTIAAPLKPGDVASDPASNRAIYVSEQKKDPVQDWLFKKLGDKDRWAIQCANAGRYLGFAEFDLRKYADVEGKDKQYEWELQSIGGFAYSIVVPEKDLALGFADYSADPGDKVRLMGNVGALSQTWLIEPWDVLGLDNSFNPVTTVTTQISAGKYRIRNLGTNSWMINNTNTSTRRNSDYPFGSATTTDTTYTIFDVAYVGGNIININGAQRSYWLNVEQTEKGATVVPNKNVRGQFYLAKQGNTDTEGYFIVTSPPETSPRSVIVDSPTYSRGDEFRVVDLVLNDKNQKWVFEKYN